MKRLFWIFVLQAFLHSAVFAAEEDDPRNLFHDYAVVKPTIYIKGKECDYTQDTGFQVCTDEEISLDLETTAKSFRINLKTNKDLVSKDYFMSYQEKGQTITQAPAEKVPLMNCYYQGSIEGVEGSWAALSICGKLRGAFFDGSENYFVEPDTTSENNMHFLFKESDVKFPTDKCEIEVMDLDDLREQYFNKYKSKFADRTDKQSRLTIEVFIIDDKAEYQKSKSDRAAVERKNLDIVNIADARYGLLNMSVSLASSIIWNDQDRMTVSSDSSATLKALSNYRRQRLLTKNPSDVGTLLTGVRFDKSVTGRAYLGGACSDFYAAAVFSDHNVVGLVASTYTHELGHSLGMPHDVDSCQCPVSQCVMDAYAGDKKVWSSCSQDLASGLPNDKSKDCLSKTA